MSHICIRRTKEMQNERGEAIVPLPPVEMIIVPVALDPVTRVSSIPFYSVYCFLIFFRHFTTRSRL